MTAATFFRRSELDSTTFPEFRDQILRAEADGIVHQCRSYSGYPKIPLPRFKPRRLVALEQTLLERRSHRKLDTTFPGWKAIGRILQFAHAVNADQSRGPVPSGGGLQALEIYIVAFGQGLYHYDRAGHFVSEIRKNAVREEWQQLVPSLLQFEGGSLLWVLAGDAARVERKYGDRAFRFLLLEAGHLMQNLCLLSASWKACTLPLGGFFEQQIAEQFFLPGSDVILYVAAFGGKL